MLKKQDNMKKLFLVFILLYSIAFTQNGVISGVVTDSASSISVPFLNIYLENNTSKGTTTDIDGKYSLILEPGTYNLVFSSIDYAKKVVTVTVKDGDNINVSPKLSARATEIGTFVKSESKFEKRIEEVTVTLEVLKPYLVENKNATTADAALQSVPGVNIVDNEPQIRSGSGYSFGAGSRVMILVDDVPLLSGDAGRPSWGFIPIENLEQIEVIKGASSVLYGSSALNGVINVRTAYPREKPQTKITAFAGVYNLQDTVNWATDFPPFQTGMSFLHSRRIKKNFDLVIGGNLFQEKSPIGPAVVDTSDLSLNPDTVLNGEYTYRARMNFNTRYRVPGKDGLSFGINGNVMFAAYNGSFLWGGADRNIFRCYQGTMTRTLQTIINIDPYVTYIGKKGSSYYLRTRYFYLNNNNNNNQGNTSNLFFGEFQYQKKFLEENLSEKMFFKNFLITTGVMTTFTYGLGQLYAGAPQVPPSNSIFTDTSIYTNNLNVAAYLQLENKFFDRLTINLGARLEYFNIGKYDRYDVLDTSNQNASVLNLTDNSTGIQPVFRGGFSLMLAKATFLRGSFGQGYRFPTIAERYINTAVGGAVIAANPKLRPELSWSVEGGIKQGFKIGKNWMGYADLAGYYQFYKDYIEFNFVFNLPAPLSGPGFISLNTGDAQVWGIDFSLAGTGKIGKDWKLSVLAGYNYSLPQNLQTNFNYGAGILANPTTYSNSSSDTTNNVMKYRFLHTAKFDAEVTWKWLTLGASVRYNSAMQNVDLAFVSFLGPSGLGLLPEIKAFRDARKDGDAVVDLRLAAQISKSSKVSLIISNVGNRIYSLRPGRVEAPRLFVIQYNYQF